MAQHPPSDNLYITGLPSEIDEAAVKQIFGQYSPVVQCKVLPQMQGDKRAAFARFEDTAAATWMIEQLNGNIPRGLADPIRVAFAAPPGSSTSGGGGGGSYGRAATSIAPHQPSPYAPPTGQGGGDGPEPHDNLYVTGLPEGISQEDVMAIFGKFGTVMQTKLLGAKFGSTAALVRWSSAQEAAWVKDSMNGQVPPGLQSPVEVRFADNPQGRPRQQAAGQPQFGQWARGPEGPAQAPWGAGKGGRGGKGGPQDPMDMDFILQQFEASGALPGSPGFDNTEKIALYVSGVPHSCRDIHLYRLFAPFGPIAPKGVRAMLNPEGRCKGFGFVDFLDANAAQNAIMILNNAELPDGTIMKVSVKADKGSKQTGADDWQQWAAAEPMTDGNHAMM
mmetsp:Transcript_88506/g.250810  ORF Transcript_88506/g.250810 Transcript_88506/m.250810 type:complete len:391 (+) Transcript_88506:60-1232(+)